MTMSILDNIRPLTKREQRRRGLALAEADHACDREGLPPASRFARVFDAQWIAGERSADEIVGALVRFHSDTDGE